MKLSRKERKKVVKEERKKVVKGQSHKRKRKRRMRMRRRSTIIVSNYSRGGEYFLRREKLRKAEIVEVTGRKVIQKLKLKTMRQGQLIKLLNEKLRKKDQLLELLAETTDRTIPYSIQEVKDVRNWLMKLVPLQIRKKIMCPWKVAEMANLGLGCNQPNCNFFCKIPKGMERKPVFPVFNMRKSNREEKIRKIIMQCY